MKTINEFLEVPTLALKLAARLLCLVLVAAYFTTACQNAPPETDIKPHTTDTLQNTDVPNVSASTIPTTSAVSFTPSLSPSATLTPTAVPTALTAENAEPADVKEAFLLACTTYNYEGRYETLLKNLETATADMTVEKIAAEQKEYYASVSKYVSEKFYQKMCANREILKYEKHANEHGYTYRPDGFEFTEYSKNGDKITYSFVVHLIVTNSDGTEKRVTVKGQITVQEKDGEALITSCWPTGFVPIEDFR